MKKIFLLIIVLSINSYAQFDSLIFSKEMRINGSEQDVDGRTVIYPLGDQNKDGFDDILLYDCNDKRGYIYFGGSPMDTIAVNSIQFFDSVYVGGSIAIIDINNDGIKDIVATTVLLSDSGFYYLGRIRIYYGGDKIDSIPSLTFNPPTSATGDVPQVLKDFNGDGKNELIIRDANLPFSTKQYGTLYFYNTKGQFDTIPDYIITGDSVKKISIGGIESSGDINGDGKTDFTILGFIEQPPHEGYYRSFYLGNENFDLKPAVTYYQDEHSFDVEYMNIINDINGDGKDDILIHDYGFYPYYYQAVILHGSFPIDTIPDVGLNTQNEGLNFAQIYSLGDVNGARYNDFFAQARNFGYRNIKLWVGGRNMPLTLDDVANRTWFGTSDGFGRTLSNVGDVDGDGVNDIAIGQIPFSYDSIYKYCNKSRIYILKGDTNVIGDTGTVGVIDKDNILKDYYLYEPYPNPFNPSTVISWQSVVSSFVTINVFDILGRKIITLLNEEETAGQHKLEFNASKYKLSSGVYLINLKIMKGGKEIFTKSKKITLLK